MISKFGFGKLIKYFNLHNTLKVGFGYRFMAVRTSFRTLFSISILLSTCNMILNRYMFKKGEKGSLVEFHYQMKYNNPARCLTNGFEILAISYTHLKHKCIFQGEGLASLLKNVSDTWLSRQLPTLVTCKILQKCYNVITNIYKASEKGKNTSKAITP